MGIEQGSLHGYVVALPAKIQEAQQQIELLDAKTNNLTRWLKANEAYCGNYWYQQTAQELDNAYNDLDFVCLKCVYVCVSLCLTVDG